MAEESHAEQLRFAVLAADSVLFTVRDGALLVRIVAIDQPHFPNSKGLPGGLIKPHETGLEAAKRILHDKAGIAGKEVYSEQLFTFTKVDRDPRGRVVAVSYLCLVPWQHLPEKEKEDTDKAWWSSVSKASKLAYDHDEILKVAIQRLRSRATYTTVISKLMPKEFTLTELESMYEAVTGKELDKRNFRKKILKLNVLTELPKKRSGGRFRPAALYSFASHKIEEIEVL